MLQLVQTDDREGKGREPSPTIGETEKGGEVKPAGLLDRIRAALRDRKPQREYRLTWEGKPLPSKRTNKFVWSWKKTGTDEPK